MAYRKLTTDDRTGEPVMAYWAMRPPAIQPGYRVVEVALLPYPRECSTEERDLGTVRPIGAPATVFLEEADYAAFMARAYPPDNPDGTPGTATRPDRVAYEIISRREGWRPEDGAEPA